MSDVTLKRIMDLETQSEIDNSVYTIIDSPTGYGKKFPLGGLVKEVTDLKEDLNNVKNTVTYERPLLLGASTLAGNNNTAITNNNDGTYTVGTTDYGITTFGNGTPIILEAGDYYLYGVPNGMSFLSTSYTVSTAYKNKIFENQSPDPAIFHTDTQISVYVGFRSPSAPAESYTIAPSLYMIAAENKELYKIEAISLNGNYFEDIASAWTDGWYRTANGVIDTSDTLQYAFCPIVGAGTYTEVIQYAVFGVSANVIALADEKYNFAKSITGVRDGNNVTFSITDDDTLQCKYVVMRRDKTKAFSPKLFYNATASGGIYTLNPVYGYTSDKLYKKTIVCDGDSICFGYRDEPKQYGSWFGRLQNDYQVSGHNYAVSGATITDMQPSVSHSVALNIDVIHTDYPTLDYLILEGGTNDADRIGNFNGDTPPEGFGTWSDDSASDYNGGYDNTTFCGAVDEMFYKAVTYYPNAKIGFIIPMQMGTYTTSSIRRRRYFDEIVKIANKWHVNVLDLWNICHADARIPAYYSGTEGDLTKFYYDGQHPTSVGYDLMQPMIEAWLKTL
ncbi:MAG: SGNH/GDSL hydrolase family protein [Bacteroidaceae bacterium]|nr:SGNH/GDSL hydrolase family protein [Bacteroidaceae bacterium]